MPKPRKPSSAQAWAQGLGNTPNKFASGPRSLDLVSSNSSGDHVRNTAPVLVTGGGPKARGGFQCVSLDNYTAEEIMNHVDSLDAEYAKRHPGFVSKPWTEGEVRRLKESCKPSTTVASTGKNDVIQKKTPQITNSCDEVETKFQSAIGEAIKASLAKPDPDRPHTTLILDDDRLFVINKGVTNDDIDDFVAEMEAFGEQKKAGLISAEVEDEKWDNVIQKASKIAYEMKNRFEYEGPREDLDPDAVRCSVGVSPMMCDPRIACCEGIAREMIAMMRNDHAYAIIVYGKHYLMHEDCKDEDMADFIWKFVGYKRTKVGDETEKRKLLESLMSFTDEVVEPLVVEHGGASVLLDNTKLFGSSTFAVLFSESNGLTYERRIELDETKEANSNEVDEYEEVDGFDPHNIKCKCTIS